MYSALTYEAQKAVIQERLREASRRREALQSQQASRPRGMVGRRAHRAIAAVLFATVAPARGSH